MMLLVITVWKTALYKFKLFYFFQCIFKLDLPHTDCNFQTAIFTDLCNFLVIFELVQPSKVPISKQHTCLSTWLYTRDAHVDSSAFPLFISGLAHWPQQNSNGDVQHTVLWRTALFNYNFWHVAFYPRLLPQTLHNSIVQNQETLQAKTK